jgi:hypothetical protein
MVSERLVGGAVKDLNTETVECSLSVLGLRQVLLMRLVGDRLVTMNGDEKMGMEIVQRLGKADAPGHPAFRVADTVKVHEDP